MDAPWDDRYRHVVGPYGHQWLVARHVQDVGPDELGRRMAEAFENEKRPPADQARQAQTQSSDQDQGD
jgi:hypothetical protein